MNATLHMVLLGCRPPGRHTEQHDVFFGIGESVKELIPAIGKSWPEAKGNIHIDAWRSVHSVDEYTIQVVETHAVLPVPAKELHLFFINLGGYKVNEFDEFHYKMLIVAENLEAAKAKAKASAFFKHTSVPRSANTPTATAHIDDKFGIDVDDAFKIEEILPDSFKENYRIQISQQPLPAPPDELHLGYFRLTDWD